MSSTVAGPVAGCSRAAFVWHRDDDDDDDDGPMQGDDGDERVLRLGLGGQRRQHPTAVLRNGVEMPMLGVGCTHSGGYSHEAVVHALRRCNYRLIDTARRYGTEPLIAKSVREAGVDRSSLFICTKMWPTDFGYANALQAWRKSSERLDTDYIDCYLLHFPILPDYMTEQRQVKEDTWRAMELLLEAEKCRAIGVSNYTQTDLEELFEFASVRPHMNQCEFHPFYNPLELRRFCRDNGVLFSGYCPLAKGRILHEPVVQRLARKHGRTPAQVCIRWSIDNGVPAIPKSTRLARVAENADVFDFRLDPDDLEATAHLHDESKKVVRWDDLQDKFTLPDGYKLVTSASALRMVPANSPEIAKRNGPNAARMEFLGQAAA